MTCSFRRLVEDDLDGYRVGQAGQDCLKTGTKWQSGKAGRSGSIQDWDGFVWQGRQVKNVSGLEQGFAVVKTRLSIVLALIRTVCRVVIDSLYKRR